LGVQSQQLLMKSQVFKDEVLTGTESADQPAEEKSERSDHSRNHIGKVRIKVCAKLFILQVYDVLAKDSCIRGELNDVDIAQLRWTLSVKARIVCVFLSSKGRL